MGGYPPANVVTIDLNPDEISVEIVTNQGGGRFRLGTAQLCGVLVHRHRRPRALAGCPAGWGHGVRLRFTDAVRPRAS